MSEDPQAHGAAPPEEGLPPLKTPKLTSPKDEPEQEAASPGQDEVPAKTKKHHKKSSTEENDGTPRRKKRKHKHSEPAQEQEQETAQEQEQEGAQEQEPPQEQEHEGAQEQGQETTHEREQEPPQEPEHEGAQEQDHEGAQEQEAKQEEEQEGEGKTRKKKHRSRKHGDEEEKSSSSSDSSSSSGSSSSRENAQAVDGEGDGVLITAVDDPAQRPETAAETPAGSDLSESEPEQEPDLPPVAECKYSEEDLQAALDRMLKKKRMPEMEMRPYLVDYAKDQSVYQLMRENYDQAAKIDEAVDLLMQSLHRDEDAQDCEKQTESLKEKYQTAQVQNKHIQDEFAQRIGQLREAENERLARLERQHERERSEFEEQWARPETTATYSKPSAQLLQVRKMQKSMAIAHKFEEAKKLKATGDQMQREESVVASQKAVGAMKVAYQQLIDKQEREMDCFMANGYRKLQTLETERDKKLQANEKLRNQLDTRIKGPKVPRRPPVPIPDLAPADTRGSVTGVISTRTRSQLAVYKKSPETTRLQIQLGDIQKITKPMTPSPKKGKPRRRF